MNLTRNIARVLLLSFALNPLLPLGTREALADQTQLALSRNAQSEFTLGAQLTKDEYRYEERTETYTVQVPYTVEVPYQDTETYYTERTVCENVPRTEQVCHNEQRCEQVPKQDCHTERQCSNALAAELDSIVAMSAVAKPGNGNGNGNGNGGGNHGGGNHGGGNGNGGGNHGGGNGGGNSGGGNHGGGGGNHGGGGGNGGGGSGPVCRDVRVCHERTDTVCRNVPVCHSETRWERVCQTIREPHTRVVTRIRYETHYRTEERTRVVTVPVFDHTWAAQVQISFPPEATLMGDESESVITRLGGNEFAPDVEVAVDSPVYSYRVAEKTRNGTQLVVRLEMVARYNPEDLGRKTITDLVLANAGGGNFQLRFRDFGLAARVETQYALKLTDKTTGQVVFEQALNGAVGVRDVVVPVTNGVVNADHDHLLQLRVQREGIVLSGKVDFDVAAEQIAQLDPRPYIDPNGVRQFSLAGAGVSAQLVFTDITPNDGRVDTTYELTLKRKVWGFLWKTTVAKGVFEKAKLKHDGTLVTIPLNAFPGLTREKLGDLFDPGATFYVEASVKRVSARLKGHSPVAFKKEAQVAIAKGRRGD